MPCYLFTYHAFGSWMPDRRRGYVKRHAGILPPDERMAELYRANVRQAEVCFTDAIQRTLIDQSLDACNRQHLRCHYIATESTHVHVLVSWRIKRTWRTTRAKLRESLTRRLNEDVSRQAWFSKSPSRKRVRNRKHFEYLVREYLPKHKGWKWSEERGVFR
jgi:hypothetical protein